MSEAARRAPFPGAAEFVPASGGVRALATAVQKCRGCDLYRPATQAVFSRGSARAAIVLVGEQPGDIEDQEGVPFVGPAGHLLDRALADAGIDSGDAYLTNAVKHFKFEQRGKRRIHQKPQRSEIVACRPWLVAEFRTLSPRVIVALGATAASALLGTGFRVSRSRGELLPWPAASDRPADFPTGNAQVLATIHPSAVLRDPDRDRAYAGLVADLAVAARASGG
jgi:uracil-DNA glycosylase family protein